MLRVRWMPTFVAALVGVALCAAPSLAIDEKPAPKKDAHGQEAHAKDAHAKDAAGKDANAKGGHDEHKEPQIFEWALDLGIWSMVVFLLLLFILSKYAWKPMLEGLRKREETIRSAVEEAQLARAEAAHARADFQKKMDEAYAEIPRLMDEARREAQALKEEMRAQAQQEIQTERQRLRREIETAKDQAVQDLFMQGANLATMLCTRVIPRELTPEDHRRLVDQAMNEMKQAHEQR